MTRPMHQDAAAAVLRRTMVLLLLLLMFSLSSFPSVTAECPDKCWCAGENVYCHRKELDRIPDRIPPNTKTLFLRLNNGIRDIKSLDHLTELKTLYLIVNKIRDIEPKTFTHLTELDTLFLSHNNISELKNGAFSNLSKLQELFLDGNKIENIETGVFNNLTSLKELHLNGNKIHKLDLEIFKGLTKLDVLYLDQNMISYIPPGIFDSLTSLISLLLSNNRISELKNGAFSNLSKLQKLFLNENEIENIESGVFNNLTSLKELHLHSNKIHKLDLEIFKGLTKLDVLYLDQNMISNIPPGIFDSLTSLISLRLGHNPLTCDCNILLFMNVLKKNYPQRDVLWSRYSNQSCYFPVNMREKSLKEITENDFNCTSPDVIVVPENKIVSVGEQLQLSCKAIGNPEPSITWAKDNIDLELGQRVQVLQNNTLIISEVERTDGGQYKCVSSNSFGRKSFEAMVNVNAFPDVIAVPEDKTVSVGEQLKLSCKAVGYPEPSITWAKDDIDLELSQRVQVLQNNTLIISEVERTDGGQYKCVASNSFGQKSFDAMVNVNGTGILCNSKHERRLAVSSRSKNTDDKFNCSNGESIEWPLLCDDFDDCSDGSDETKELCALYEFETNMTMDCGRVHNMKNQVTAKEAGQSIIELAPWTVAIYRTIAESKFQFIQPASIIAPNIVISIDYYFWDICKTYEPTDDSKLNLFKIGPMTPMVNSLEDYKLLINISMIYSKADNIDYRAGNDAEKTIAVIVLANKLPLSNGYGFTPICIDWFSKYDKRKKTQMRIFGRKVNSTGDYIKVIQYFTHFTLATDKTFHIKFNTDTHLDYVFQGSGLGILYSNTYYLTGVLNYKTFRNINSSREVDTIQFINIKNYVSWIRGILNKHVTVNSCVLPTVEGVIYSYEDSNEILSPGTLIDRHINVTENCENGYRKASRYSYRVCLGNGKWSSSSDKLCFNKCPPLVSDSLDIKCTHNGKYVNCSNPSIPDTIAIPLCKPLYTAPNGHEKESLELLCQSNGTWNKELYSCNPSCGKNYTINNGMIMGGGTALAGTAPWNVGVYEFNKTFSNNYDLICGGSIISPNFVVSAAHCFWNKGISSNKISVNDGQYKIAVGKYSRNITMIDNEFTKIMNVETVHLNADYRGSSWFHADDIAIVVLRNRISFSIGVLPVCVDWIGINTIPNGDKGKDYHGYSGFHADDIAIVVLRDTISFSIRVSPVCVDWIGINIIPNVTKGKIVGWGKTEKGIDSPVLQEASLPYIDQSTCRKMYTNGFELYVTKDKFCAGSELGQGVNEGDSGAGLSFLHSNLYYLTGVTSMKDPYTNNSIAVFTEVKHHIQWIRRLYDEHH